MSRLVRLYPRGWRQRYGEEFAALVEDQPGRRAWLILDVVRGAVDARLFGRYGMRRHFTDAAVRRGAYDGLILSTVMAVLVVLTNVVFPSTQSDNAPGARIQIAAGYLTIALLLVAIGARARRRSGGTVWSGAKGGATAGLVLAVAATAVFLTVNNLFLDIVSRQHDKQAAFAASGWSSMRAYISVQQLIGAVYLLPAATLGGAALGLLGGLLFSTRAEVNRLNCG